MIADKFSKDAKVKLTLFQKKSGKKRFGVYAIVSFERCFDSASKTMPAQFAVQDLEVPLSSTFKAKRLLS